jgi:hypothetical protein
MSTVAPPRPIAIISGRGGSSSHEPGERADAEQKDEPPTLGEEPASSGAHDVDSYEAREQDHARDETDSRDG